ncbi:MAG: VWA domain-containing protein [Acidobacteria bacterium]|nr:VWA domain-containing protein [Acidobacteriota bacterium]
MSQDTQRVKRCSWRLAKVPPRSAERRPPRRAHGHSDGNLPLDEFFVVHFNERVWMGVPGGAPFTRGPVVLTEALSHIGAYGKTALYDAVERGFLHLSDAGNPHRALVVVSDGGDNASAMPFERLLQHAQQADTIIYTIGLFDQSSRDRNPRILKELAAATGGEAFLPGSIRGATAVLERIARDIRSTYLVGYEPTNTVRDGNYRNVRVVVDAAGRGTLKVRARPGYFAPASTEP